ncbi:MAG: OB-fold nucleic acid binding domain-containing protein [Acidobacteria bacterium]|nr:OB-fold nucleic acid binding domain-containing protein [Acidobacteriota bacterium]
MKTVYAADLKPDQEITAAFLVANKEVRQKRTGEPFLSLMLQDRTGDVDAKMWDNAASVADKFAKDDIIEVKGTVQVFQGRIQLTIQRLKKLEDASVDLGDFMPASRYSGEAMFAELQAMVASMADADLRQLLDTIFADSELVSAFKQAPAAKTVHHAFLGGLLEHVLSMAKIGQTLAKHYPGIDADLLLAGVVLHDIGKTRELTYRRSFGYSTEGQLLGHIHIGLGIIIDAFRKLPEFPAKKRMLLEHLILSHHGTLEYGSPKVPVFLEAMLLHQIDMMDSKMEAVRAAIADDNRVDGEWTGYVNSLERGLLKKDKFLASEGALSPAAPVLPSSTPAHTEPATLAGQLAKVWQSK